MTAAADFQRTIRSGRRFGTPTVVAHYWCCDADEPAPKVGLAVGRGVGNSVVRHRVARRLRHVCQPHLGAMADGSRLVLRATPRASSASSARMAADLSTALAALQKTES